MTARPLRVLRLCSVFEPPDRAIAGRGARASVVHVGLPVRRARQLWALPAAALAPLLARRADLVHAHLGEDLAVRDGRRERVGWLRAPARSGST